MVATFGQNRFEKKTNRSFELIRMATSRGFNIIGGASKLIKLFERTYSPVKIISYCDLRWRSGEVYNKMGFEIVKITEPNYFWVKGGKRFNRFLFRKSELVKMGHDKNKTEDEIMKSNKYYKIYDCGNLKLEKTF